MRTYNAVLLWAPRLILIAFALFLIIFSFDVFEQGKTALEIAIAFMLHNIPTMLLSALVIISWRREWIGALVCLVLALAYIVWSWGRFPPSVYFIMVAPLLLVAALYTVNWRFRTRGAGTAGRHR